MPIRSYLPLLLLLAVAVPGAVSAAPAATAAPAAGQPRAVLTLAEQPVRLIRGAAVFKAPAGVALQKDDILETGAGGAQVEAGADAIVALGPQTRVLVANLAVDARAPIELNLLQGWAKVQARGRRAVVTTPALQVSMPSGATIVHAAGGQDAVFAEEGEQLVARIDEKGRAGTPMKLGAEQYAQIDASKPQPVAGRPPRGFVTALPPAFRDRLASVRSVPNAGKALPVRERDADFADVGAWLQSPLPARKSFVARFRPRLAEPAFRKELDRTLGQSAEWKPVLHPVRPSPGGTLF
jgi:hypothetical protein